MDGGRAKAARMDTPTPLMASLHAALGGAIGSVLRYQTGRAMTHWLGAQTVTAFPWATLAVNLIGSLASNGGCSSASACSAGSRRFPPSASS